MKTMRIFVGTFDATVLCLIWLTTHAVDSDQLSAPKEVTGMYGGSVTVSCQYNLHFIENQKYWCKGRVYDFCVIMVTTSKSIPGGRTSIADDKEAGVFTVTMTSLRDSDENSYWCVISRQGRNIYADVKLYITHTAVTPTTTPSLILEHDEVRLLCGGYRVQDVCVWNNNYTLKTQALPNESQATLYFKSWADYEHIHIQAAKPFLQWTLCELG